MKICYPIMLIAVILLFCFNDCFSQCLSEQEITAAVDHGLRNKKKEHGLNLEDQTKNALNAFINMNRSAYAQRQDKGFSITVFTPITWIQQMAANAAKEYRTFTAKDVTDEMQNPVMAVVVYGRKGKDYQQIFGESVQHVVIRTEDRSTVIQPTSIDSFADGQQNIFGASEEYVGKQALFELQEVIKLRKASPDTEFFITVIGEKSEKDFKIKKKHFERLPMPRAVDSKSCAFQRGEEKTGNESDAMQEDKE